MTLYVVFGSEKGSEGWVEAVVKRSARAIVIDDRGRLVLIKRTKPGTAPYWTAPGGGVESDDPSVEAALVRELREELGAEVDSTQQVFLVSNPVTDGVGVQHFFVCRLRALDSSQRSGPEFDDPARGGYDLDRVALSGDALANLDLKPEELRTFVVANRVALLDAAGIQGSSNGGSHERHGSFGGRRFDPDGAARESA